MIKELSEQEQRRMTVDEAGKLFTGYFIFFTNSELPQPGTTKKYAVPRVISTNQKEFCESGLFEKYRDRQLFGVPYFCSAYLNEEQIPRVLSF